MQIKWAKILIWLIATTIEKETAIASEWACAALRCTQDPLHLSGWAAGQVHRLLGVPCREHIDRKLGEAPPAPVAAVLGAGAGSLDREAWLPWADMNPLRACGT